ncbi:unnamed protein product [Mortierella alpina]
MAGDPLNNKTGQSEGSTTIQDMESTGKDDHEEVQEMEQNTGQAQKDDKKVGKNDGKKDDLKGKQSKLTSVQKEFGWKRKGSRKE